MTCRGKALLLFGLLVAVLAPPARSDEELGHIYCLSARTAIRARDFARAGEQLRRAREADPGSTEALLLLGDLARAQEKNDEARSQYATCIKALAGKRAWTQRDLNVRVELSLRLFSEDDQRKLAELVGRQATRWLDAARGLARQGSQPCADAASAVAASLHPQAAREAAVADYAADRTGWTPLVTEAGLKRWRPLRGKWSYEKGALTCQGSEALIAAPPKSSVRDLRFQVRGDGKAQVRVDLGRFAVHVDFAAKRLRVACQSPGEALRAPLKDADWHAVSLIHRRAGVEATVDKARVGLFRHQRAEGLVGVQILGGRGAVRRIESRPPQAEPEEPEVPEWMRRMPRRPRPAAPPALTTGDDLIAAGRSLEAIVKLVGKRKPMVADTLSLSTALEQRGLDRWAAEVCDAGLKRGFVGSRAQKLTLHRAHLALRLGDATRAGKLARASKDVSESTLVLLGDAYHRIGKRTQAIAEWRRALKLNPLRDDVAARLKAAGVTVRRAEAALTLERSVELLKPTVAVISGAARGGSGFFLTPDGLLLTNHHVIAKVAVPKVTAIFQDGEKETRETFPIGEVVATDARLDLALVRVAPRGRRFRPVRLSRSGVPKLGSRVLVIGSPGFGEIRLDYTVTQGIVSSGLRSMRGSRYVQTDAAINPGNSGGPVFNDRGEAIGVATAGIRFAQNVGFFVPSILIRDYLKRERLP